jgi:hypothetical protein
MVPMPLPTSKLQQLAFFEPLYREVSMTLELIREFLLWSCALNVGLLVWWFAFIALAHDWVTKCTHGGSNCRLKHSTLFTTAAWRHLRYSFLCSI